MKTWETPALTNLEISDTKNDLIAGYYADDAWSSPFVSVETGEKMFDIGTNDSTNAIS